MIGACVRARIFVCVLKTKPASDVANYPSELVGLIMGLLKGLLKGLLNGLLNGWLNSH